MKHAFPSLFALLVLAASSLAQEASTASIEKFFELTKMKKQYENGLISGFDATSGRDRLKMLPEEQRKKAESALDKVRNLMLEKVGWDAIKPDMIELYAAHFTTAEIDKVNAVYTEPFMQAFIEKQIALQSDASKLGMEKADAVKPEAIELMKREMAK